MKATTALTCVLALAVAQPVLAETKATHSIPVTDDFSPYEVTWTGGLTSYSGMWATIVVDGMIEICGVGAFRNANSVQDTKRVMRQTSVYFGEQRILKDLNFFARIKPGDDVMKARANCAPTGVPAPQGSYSVELRSGPLTANGSF